MLWLLLSVTLMVSCRKEDPGEYPETLPGSYTWVRIYEDKHQSIGSANWLFITGDKHFFGRVYRSTEGRGIVYGDLEL